jgi:hypothetical protein
MAQYSQGAVHFGWLKTKLQVRSRGVWGWGFEEPVSLTIRHKAIDTLRLRHTMGD